MSCTLILASLIFWPIQAKVTKGQKVQSYHMLSIVRQSWQQNCPGCWWVQWRNTRYRRWCLRTLFLWRRKSKRVYLKWHLRNLLKVAGRGQLPAKETVWAVSMSYLRKGKEVEVAVVNEQGGRCSKLGQRGYRSQYMTFPRIWPEWIFVWRQGPSLLNIFLIKVHHSRCSLLTERKN